MSFSRNPVKATYGTKKARNRRHVASTTQISSPLENLTDQEEDLSRSQMARRMLKRTRQAAQITDETQAVDPDPSQEPDRSSKRTKRTVPTSLGVDNDSVTSLNDLRTTGPTDASQFQTPFGDAYIHPSLVTQPLSQEEMSPLPVANRILSRTSSRNLKENATKSRPSSSKGLASPFTSRHNSDHSSPGSKKPRKSLPKSKNITTLGTRRPALTTKSHSFNSTSQNKASSKSQPLQPHEPAFTMNHSAHTSPRLPNPLARNRFPSSHTLAQVSRPDWFVPPKIVNRNTTMDSDEEMSTPPDFGIERSIGSSSFLADSPLSFSTPSRRKLPTLASAVEDDGYSSPSLLYGLGHDTPAFLHDADPFRGQASSFYGTNLNDEDVRMTDAVSRPRKILHISANSIVSTSGDFTLATLPNPAVSRAENRDEIDSLFPSNDDITMQPRVQEPEKAVAPQQKQSLAQKCIPLFSSPVVQRSRSSSFVNALMAMKPAAPLSVPPLAPTAEAEIGSEVLLEDIFNGMGLDGSNRSMPSRAHSLDHSASIRLPATAVDKGKGKRPATRARAGTIRASDFQNAQPPPASRSSTAEAGVSRARRTRSGTIVGPNASNAIIAPAAAPSDPSSRPTASAPPLAAVEDVVMEPESDDELLLKSPGWIDADLEYIGLPARKKVRGKRVSAQPRDESPDPLALPALRPGKRWGG
ncbi:hypothetical protein FIBSPDRAFT_936496 [Athelia psychrophila]|uniref:Uncharacterized protein n=1 Tax=Athelia psychrophila TaxID=1759441 RepID=A0A166C371_9AGAM|nr:hypothetical protein FIBSPDRAFT_936496 [Fibularhizoctonia sp. CBS 109695]